MASLLSTSTENACLLLFGLRTSGNIVAAFIGALWRQSVKGICKSYHCSEDLKTRTGDFFPPSVSVQTCEGLPTALSSVLMGPKGGANTWKRAISEFIQWAIWDSGCDCLTQFPHLGSTQSGSWLELIQEKRAAVWTAWTFFILQGLPHMIMTRDAYRRTPWFCNKFPHLELYS